MDDRRRVVPSFAANIEGDSTNVRFMDSFAATGARSWRLHR